MNFTSVEQVRLGLWVTQCCELDLFQIAPADVENVRENVALWLEDDEPGCRYEYWEDEKAALLELRSRYRPGELLNDQAIADIDRRLAEIG